MNLHVTSEDTTTIMKKKPVQQSVEFVECLDRIDAHRQNLQTLAQLLALCDEVSCMVVDARMVGGTGWLLLEELEKLRGTRDLLAKKIER